MITEFHLAVRWLGHLAWTIPLVLLACAWGVARRRQILARFGIEPGRFGEWLAAGARRHWLRASVASIALLFFTLAAVQPRCNPEKTRFRQSARDIAVVVDVSRSMLAEDLKPNRLERAKLELDRLCDELKGDRIGLVAFAGNAVIMCPLTSNYSYFRSVLKNLSPRSASQGGTKIGDAIRKALKDLLGARVALRQDEPDDTPDAGETQVEAEATEPRERSFADILLITDGEDHRSYPEDAAERCAGVDVGLYIVGIGSEEGTPIPITTQGGNRELLKYEGEIVKSRLGTKTLMEMIHRAPRGSFLPVKTANPDLVSFYRDVIAAEEGRDVWEEHVSWTEIYQAFLLAGIAFYWLFLVIPSRSGRQSGVEWTEVNS